MRILREIQRGRGRGKSFISYSSNLLTQHLSNKFLLQHQDCGEQRQDLRPQPAAQLPAQHPRVRPQALRGNNDYNYDIIDDY